jgi:ADP-heptose:LPS heptosyltransferase
MKRILLVQFTRIGDTLQSTPLIAGLKEKYPDSHIAVLVRPGLKRVIEDDPSIDELIVFDTQPLLNELVKDESGGFVRAYSAAQDLVELLRGKKFDVAINLTHSRFSAVLLRLVGCPDTRGMTLSHDWMRVIRSAWPTYFINSVFNRAYNDFNIVDVYRKFGDPDLPPCKKLVMAVSDDDRAYTDGLLTDTGIEPGARFVCFQPGASDAVKQWPTDSFARLGDLVVEKLGMQVVLVGTESERPLGGAVRAAMSGPATMMFGNTNLGQLGALLGRAECLVTNDTGVMHVASAAGVPIVALSFSYVFFRETGPYGEGHIVVQANLDCAPCRPNQPCFEQRCKGTIRPEHVLHAIGLAGQCKEGVSEPAPDSPEHSDVGYYVSRFGSDGFIEYRPLIQRPVTLNELVNMVYRTVWRDSLDGVVTDPESVRRSLADSLASYSRNGDLLGPKLERCADAFRKFASLANEGAGKARDLAAMSRPPITADSQREIQKTVGSMMALDQKLSAEGRSVDVVRPLAALLSFEKENLEGTDFCRLTEATLAFYEAAGDRARAMADRLETAAVILSSD